MVANKFRRRLSRLAQLGFLLAGMASLALVSCSPSRTNEAELIVSAENGKQFTVYTTVAVSPREKRQSLAAKDAIGFNEGRLFVYGGDKQVTCSMRGARNDLSVAFLDSTGAIQEIFNMQIDPNTVYRSSHKCRYALQTALGWFADNDVALGDTVWIPPEIKSLKPLF